MKKISNNIKFVLCSLTIIFIFIEILFLYPVSGSNKEEYPNSFIFLIVLYSPIIAAKIFPLDIKNRTVSILFKVFAVFWVFFWIIGILFDYVVNMSTSGAISSWIIIIVSSIYLAQIAKKKKSRNHSTRNSRILPAPPMQSSPTPPPAPPSPQPRRYTLARVDAMDGHEFEHFTAELLKKLGYQRVEVTRGSGDQGVDVLAEKDGIKYAFQCKCYSSDLGNKPVQEVHAGKYIYQCHVGVVITNRYFTQGAKEAAKATGILLWDRDKLRSMIEAAAQ